MAKKKYYAVIGGKEGHKIYSDWESCKKNVHGIPGVLFKGFEKEEEAKSFLEGEEGQTAAEEIGTPYAIYVDGSFDGKDYSYGFVVVDVLKDEALHTQFGKGDHEEAALLRNVAGEMKGAMEALAYCVREGIGEVTLCYDYTGVAMWALKKWQRKNEFTEKYSQFMENYMKKVKVTFLKIKGHSGDKWNDEADGLAKEALGLK